LQQKGEIAMDIASITAAVSSLRSAVDITKAMMELKSAGDLQAKIVELQSKILAAQASALQAQEEQFEMKQKLAESLKEIESLHSWESERQRYELCEISSGAFVYVLKQDYRDNEPIHWLCTNCFTTKGAKSILQYQGNYSGKKQYACANCNGSIHCHASASAKLPDLSGKSRWNME
jgi:hypothetical protein